MTNLFEVEEKQLENLMKSKNNKKQIILLKIIGYCLWAFSCLWLGWKIFVGVAFMMIADLLMDWARDLKKIDNLLNNSSTPEETPECPEAGSGKD